MKYFLEKKAKPKSVKSTDRFVTLSELNDAILRVSTFVPNFTNVESLECQQHGKIFLRQLRGYKFWALQSELTERNNNHLFVNAKIVDK